MTSQRDDEVLVVCTTFSRLEKTVTAVVGIGLERLYQQSVV